MHDPHREELANREEIAKSLCIHALKDILHDTDDADARDAARRAIAQLGVARQNLRRYDLMMDTPYVHRSPLCGGMVR